MKNIKIFLIALFILFPLQLVFSQNLPLFDYQDPIETLINKNSGLPLGINEQVSIEVIPEVPTPGQTVNISIKSYSSEFDKANITWRVNNQIVSQGTGFRNFSFTAPESGKTSTVRVTVQKQEGGVLERTFTFAPSDVDLIYEAQTYTHPYYKGKALFTSESEVRFIAMPYFMENGVTLNPNNLVYKWSINGSVVESASGYGKRVFEGKSNLVSRPYNVEVEVSARNSNLKAKKIMFVQNNQPELVIYENNPVLGVIFEKAISGNFNLDRPELSLQAIPYYYSTKQKDNENIDYVWKINGERMLSSSRQSYITFRNETGEKGRSIISLDAEHFNNILQIATQKINLTFNSYDNSQNVFEI
jgi:hypothetical protein